jgi:CBS domain-containing protein
MLYVRDIMQSDVVTVTTDATARDVARILADEQISGVPVLDGAEQLVGVVSSTDLVRLAAEDADVQLVTSALRLGEREAPGGEALDETEEAPEEDPYGFFLPEDSPLTDRGLLAELPESRLDTTQVEEIMTPVSFTVEPGTPVTDLCEFLVRGRIHRAVVVENRQLAGIVTSADVLRAVASRRLGT